MNSCGLRITNYVDENVLIGSWSMQRIICYNNSLDEIIIEQYELTSDIDAQLNFDGSDFSYSMRRSGDCSTSAIATYVTNFEGDSRDVLDLKDVISGEVCDQSLNDSGPNSVGSVSVAFDLFAPEARDLYWEIEGSGDDSVLKLEMFTTFAGSSESSGCGGQLCRCVASYDKI